MHEHLAGAAVDGHEEMAALCLLRYLRQVFDVDVNEAKAHSL